MQQRGQLTSLELAIEQLLFDRVRTNRLAGYTVETAQEIMRLIAAQEVQGPLVPWELRCCASSYTGRFCTAPECDCPLADVPQCAREAVIEECAKIAEQWDGVDNVAAQIRRLAVTRPQCSHPRAKVWMYRDDDTFMLCPDCNAKWVAEPPSPVARPERGGAA